MKIIKKGVNKFEIEFTDINKCLTGEKLLENMKKDGYSELDLIDFGLSKQSLRNIIIRSLINSRTN